MLPNSKPYSFLLGYFRDEAAESLLRPRDNRGGQARLSATELLCALTYDCIHGIGALSSNLKRVIQVPLRNRDRSATIDGYITVREIRSELKKRDGQVIQLRFRTSLLDPSYVRTAKKDESVYVILSVELLNKKK